MRTKLSGLNRLNNDHLAWKFTYLGGHSPDSQRKDLCVKRLVQCRATADYLLVAGQKARRYYGLSH